MEVNSIGVNNTPLLNPVKDMALSDVSKKDAPWDKHRSETHTVQSIYASDDRFTRLSERMGHCSPLLGFAQDIDAETGEISLKLHRAHFCRVRNCPVCQWRRSLMWQARFYQAIPTLEQKHPNARWMFLTLTVPNCPVEELKTTLSSMNQAWQRLIKRKEFRHVLGWIRTTEITAEKRRAMYAHPHFHVLLMVPPSMFAGKYIKHSKWLELWRSCMRNDEIMNVNIKSVKARKPNSTEDSESILRKAVVETLKYSVKPDDMLSNPEWFLEVTEQIHRMRFIATGGVLKDILKVEEESDQDLITPDDENSEPTSGQKCLTFNFRPSERRYRRFEQGDYES